MAQNRHESPADAAAHNAADTVERLRAGDPAAFERVYHGYRARLFSFLLRLTRDEQLARDLLQETWLRLAANAPRLQANTEPGAWLFTVARNLFVSQRRFAIVAERALLLLRVQPPARALPSPLDAIATSRLTRELEHALAGLPLHYREVLLLSAVEGFDANQIAGMLELDPATVRKRLSRARGLVQRALPSKLDSGDEA